LGQEWFWRPRKQVEIEFLHSLGRNRKFAVDRRQPIRVSKQPQSSAQICSTWGAEMGSNAPSYSIKMIARRSGNRAIVRLLETAG
jgi:hypothetical protein